MKQFRLFILLCLFSLPALSQKVLNSDSLASDFRYLVKQLEATHPDPYSGFGGKVFFREQALRIENELRGAPAGTQQGFVDKVNTFLSHLQDGHTYLIMPSASQQEEQRRLPLKLRTIPDDIILESIPEEYKNLLGSRVTAINGRDDCRGSQRTSAQHLYGADVIPPSLYRDAGFYLQLHASVPAQSRPTGKDALSRLDAYLRGLSEA